jgi:hypothetical protein
MDVTELLKKDETKLAAVHVKNEVGNDEGF